MTKNALTVLLLTSLTVLFSCGRNNIHEQEEWATMFAEEGIDSACFEIYDHTHDQVFIHNLERCSKAYIPASTFKILHSLIALETNLAPDIDFVIPWDKKERWNNLWNQDLTMQQAFVYSSAPYYQTLALSMGRDTLQRFIDTVDYGNKTIGEQIDNFWLDGSLLITPDEQVGFLKRMYFKKLPFSDRAQRLVKKIMLQEETDTYRWYYKTGTYEIQKGYGAHLVGFVEKEETQKNVETGKMERNWRPYFFAMHFETNGKMDMSELQEKRMRLAKSILKSKEILP